MKSQEYWKNRFQLIESSQNKRGRECYSHIEQQYLRCQYELDAKINAWYQRLAKNNNVSLAEAKKMLSSKELEEFKWTVQDYIKYGKENSINQKWMKELENASAKMHISRLEALKIQTQQSIELMYGNQLDSLDNTMRDIYKYGYMQTAFEVQRGFNIGWNFSTLDQRKIDKVINNPWAVDGSNFSNRIWNNKQKLINELNNSLTRNIILGSDPQKAIDEITRSMNTSKSSAARLVMTEQAYFSSVSQLDAFKDLNVEEYEIVATLDSKTSTVCRKMDGKVFKISDYAVGINAPPFHCYCRTTFVPYFDDEYTKIEKRIARNADGKTYYVPSNMNYSDWEKSQVQNLNNNNNQGTINSKQSAFETELGKKEYGKMINDFETNCSNIDVFNVFKKNEHLINIADSNYNDTAKCCGRNIYFKKSNCIKSTTFDEPYQTIAHESGHAIDSINHGKGSGLGLHYSSKYKDGIFPQTLKDEAQQLIDNKHNEVVSAFNEHKGDWKWLSDNGYINRFDYDFYISYGRWPIKEPKASKNITYNLLKKEITSLSPKAYGDLSDILEGATNARLSCGPGHGLKYWRDRRFYGVDDGLATEAFAEFFDSYMTNPQSLNALKTYLPKSYDLFNEMIANLI